MIPADKKISAELTSVKLLVANCGPAGMV